MKKILLHCAMNKEAVQVANKLNLIKKTDNIYEKANITLLITGIGKQIAAIEVTRYLENNNKPDIIINIGYAGSTKVPVGQWVNISESYNYEWDIPGEEKFRMKDIGNQSLEKIDGMMTLECYSAEGFVTKTEIKENVIFDMELHSLAIICDLYKIKLLSLKKVSDNLSLESYYNNINIKEVMELESSIDYIKKFMSDDF